MFESGLIEKWGDISEKFTFDESRLVYIDAPLEGYLNAKDTKDIFAFRCTEIIPGILWHWVLIPVESTISDVEMVFSTARTVPPREWISIVEDHRGPMAKLVVALLSGGRTLPKGV